MSARDVAERAPGGGVRAIWAHTIRPQLIGFELQVCANFRGEVFVVAAAEQFKLLKVIPMGDEGDDQLRSSIAVSQGELFLRTGHKLYCIGSATTVSAK